jgi:hypothetical protein
MQYPACVKVFAVGCVNIQRRWLGTILLKGGCLSSAPGRNSPQASNSKGDTRPFDVTLISGWLCDSMRAGGRRMERHFRQVTDHDETTFSDDNRRDARVPNFGRVADPRDENATTALSGYTDKTSIRLSSTEDNAA